MNIEPSLSPRKNKYPALAAASLAVTAAVGATACSQNRDVMMLSGLIQYSSPAERRKIIQDRAQDLRNRQVIETEDGTWVRVPNDSVKKRNR